MDIQIISKKLLAQPDNFLVQTEIGANQNVVFFSKTVSGCHEYGWGLCVKHTLDTDAGSVKVKLLFTGDTGVNQTQRVN